MKVIKKEEKVNFLWVFLKIKESRVEEGMIFVD